MPIDRLAMAAAVAFLTTGGVLMGGGVASATFPGANDAIASSCGNGEAIYSVPNGTTNSECPPGNSPTNPGYTQSTAGSIDATPFFSANGATLHSCPTGQQHRRLPGLGWERLYDGRPGRGGGAHVGAGRYPGRGLSEELLSHRRVGFVLQPGAADLGAYRRRGQGPGGHDRRRRHDVQLTDARDG